MYYAPDGEPLSQDEWIELFEKRREDMSPESWWRKHTEIDNLWEGGNAEPIRVSTVWLGLDHGFLGPPLFWETMVFGSMFTECQWRYGSRQAAFDEHELICDAIRAGHDPEQVLAEIADE